MSNRTTHVGTDMSALASKHFEGYKSAVGATPPCLGDVQPREFNAVVEHLLGMDNETLAEVVTRSPKEMMEMGTTCQRMNEWHQGIAEEYSVLTARIACCVAKNIQPHPVARRD
jgi:hypothetical protein